MSCMFRAAGDEFDVKDFMRQFPVEPYEVWCRGKERRPGKYYEFSGFSFIASEAQMDAFEQQVADAIEFLGKHDSWLRAISSFPGVDYAGLDFGIEMPCVTIPGVLFPRGLVSAAGALGLELEASFYPCSEDTEESSS